MNKGKLNLGKKICDGIGNISVKFRYIFMGLFIAVFGVCCYFMTQVKVNYDITKYLPSSTPTAVALKITKENFGMNGNISIMAENITDEQSAEIESIITADSTVLNCTKDTSKEGSVLFKVFFKTDNYSEWTQKSIDSLRKSLTEKGYNVSINGEAVDSMAIQSSIGKEMPVILGIAVAIIFVILLATSKSWFEPVIFLLSIAVSIVINLGTNCLLGEISYIANTVSAILQLALAMDYSIILLHRYEEEKKNSENNKEALKKALSYSVKAISTSGLTTVAGLVALMLMQFSIGFDIGIVLAKGIILSMLTVFFFMPCMILLFNKVLEKTKHKSFKPNMGFLKTYAFKTRYIVPAIFVLFMVGAVVLQSFTSFTYGVSATKNKNSAVYKENQTIVQTYGSQNTLSVIFPSSHENEVEILKTARDIKVDDKDVVTSVQALSSIDALPIAVAGGMSEEEFTSLMTQFEVEARDGRFYVDDIMNTLYKKYSLLFALPESMFKNAVVKQGFTEEQAETLWEMKQTVSVLWNCGLTRIVFNLNLEKTGKNAFDYVGKLRAALNENEHIDGSCYLLGDTVSLYDVRETFKKDNIIISVVSVVTILLIVAISFRSLSVPVILVLVIQSGIWITSAISFIFSESIFFMVYLILVCIMMGASIDYAIILTSRYMENRKTMDKGESMKEALNSSVLTILTSGTIFVTASLVIGLVSTIPVISSIGLLISRGVLISVLLVLGLLPQLLILFDKVIAKTTLNSKFYFEKPQNPPETEEKELKTEEIQ